MVKEITKTIEFETAKHAEMAIKVEEGILKANIPYGTELTYEEAKEFANSLLGMAEMIAPEEDEEFEYNPLDSALKKRHSLKEEILDKYLEKLSLELKVAGIEISDVDIHWKDCELSPKELQEDILEAVKEEQAEEE